MRARLPFAMTMGDPAGIGPELALKAWLARDEIGAPFFVLADPDAMHRACRQLRLDIPIAVVTPSDALSKFETALPLVALSNKSAVEPGRHRNFLQSAQAGQELSRLRMVQIRHKRIPELIRPIRREMHRFKFQ